MKKNSRPLWRLPLNIVTNAGRRIYKGIQGAVFTVTKSGNKNYKVPKSGLKYRPVKGSPNGSKKALISPYGTIKTANNFQRMFKPKY
jgi:hypothetical protein